MGRHVVVVVVALVDIFDEVSSFISVGRAGEGTFFWLVWRVK
jgi:hypothetical protein